MLLILFLLNLLSPISSLLLYSSINLKTIHWDNIFNNLYNNKYYSTSYNYKYYNKKLLLLRKENNIEHYIYDNNILNLSNKIYDIGNNNKIYLLNNDIKVNVKEKVDNKYNLCIIHPYNQECLLDININYCNKTKKLSNIIFKKNSIEKSNYYWKNNYINIENSTNTINPFIFGSNTKLEYPLKLNKYKNKDCLYNKKFPYLYENIENKDNILVNYSGILLNIPENNIENDININLKWKFKNEFKYNILDVKYNNSYLSYINYFNYI